MAKTLTATDRSALIRLASTMEKGSEERKAILAGLSKAKVASRYVVPRRDMPPKRKGQKVKVVKPSYLVSYINYEKEGPGGRKQVKAPAGTRGVVVGRQVDYGGSGAALQDQLGGGYNPAPTDPTSYVNEKGTYIKGFRYTIRFVYPDGSEGEEEVLNGAFFDGYLRVG